MNHAYVYPSLYLAVEDRHFVLAAAAVVSRRYDVRDDGRFLNWSTQLSPFRPKFLLYLWPCTVSFTTLLVTVLPVAFTSRGDKITSTNLPNLLWTGLSNDCLIQQSNHLDNDFVSNIKICMRIKFFFVFIHLYTLAVNVVLCLLSKI